MFILNRNVGERLSAAALRVGAHRDGNRRGQGTAGHLGTGPECREGELSPTMFDLKE